MFKLLSFICIILCLSAKSVKALACKEYHNCSVNGVGNGRLSDDNRFTSRIPVWFESCNCDTKCYSFGDCCIDAPSLVPNPLKYWSILSVRISPKFSYSVLMKTKCPDEWPNKKVRQMCENIGFKESEEYFLSDVGHLVSLSADEFLLWQVTSRSTLITYRNIYCALCNNDTQLEAWTHNMKCQSTPEGRKCASVYYQTPPDFLIEEKVKRRPVQIQISASCNIGWYKASTMIDDRHAIDVVKNCSLFYAPVVVQNNQTQKLTAFKNEYCAQCSGYAKSDLLCPAQSNNFFEHQRPKHSDTSVSFDTNFISGGRIADQSTSCPVGQVYNPLADKCRVIMIEDEDTEDEEINDVKDNEITNESVVSDNYTTPQSRANELAIHSNASPLVKHIILFIAPTILMVLLSKSL